MTKNIFIAFTFLFITTLSSFGQFKRQREYSGFFDTYYFRGPITFTFGAGMTNYIGDLTKSYDKGLSYGIAIGANYKLWPHTVFGAEFSYINLQQSQDGIPHRNISFHTTGFELQAYGRLYIIDEIVRIAKDRRKESHYTFCKPYIQAGVAGLFYNSRSFVNSPSYLLVNGSVTDAAYQKLTLATPVGFGLQFTISQRSSLCAEYMYRLTLADYLDAYRYGKNDGYGIAMIKFQFAPSAPKRRKQKSLPPPAQYDGPKGTETWKTKKQQEQTAPQEEYIDTNTEEVPASEEEALPSEEENVPQEEIVPPEEQPVIQE